MSYITLLELLPISKYMWLTICCICFNKTLIFFENSILFIRAAFHYTVVGIRVVSSVPQLEKPWSSVT
jgi:hypothetical protein